MINQYKEYYYQHLTEVVESLVENKKDIDRSFKFWTGTSSYMVTSTNQVYTFIYKIFDLFVNTFCIMRIIV